MAASTPDLPLRVGSPVRQGGHRADRQRRALVTAHVPLRPSWTCVGCGSPWRCETRKRQLLAEYDGAPVSLGLFMAGHFGEAVRDMPPGAEQKTYWRFLGWLRG